MTNKIYKTARGIPIDMGAIRLQNENVRAVGNMGVNARGDRIDAEGNIIDPRNEQIQRRIQKQTNVSSGPVQSSQQKPAEPVAKPAEVLVADDIDAEDPDGPMDTPVTGITSAPVAEIPALIGTPIVPDVLVVPTTTTDEPANLQPTGAKEKPAGGLAGAIAKTKSK